MARISTDAKPLTDERIADFREHHGVMFCDADCLICGFLATIDALNAVAWAAVDFFTADCPDCLDVANSDLITALLTAGFDLEPPARLRRCSTDTTKKAGGK